MKKLFLDDIRQPPDNSYIVVRTFSAAVDYVIDNGCPDFISFDNDLGGRLEGKDFVKWLISSDLDGTINIPKDFTFDVHSWNSVARTYIRQLLTQYLKFRAESAQG